MSIERPVQTRYIVKPIGKKWGVYDRVMASWPIDTPRSGKVAQDLATEAEAQAEADRLEAARTSNDEKVS